MRTLVIIPTYNEKENIKNIITAVFEKNPQVHILVVDDNSPDGTQDIVKEMMSKQSEQLFLLQRPGKQGLGKAYLAGFEWGLSNSYDSLVEMDADFSHRPEDLIEILKKLAEPQTDFVVGSRYVSGGRTVNWGLMRKIISRGGGIYARLILGFPLNDWTGGFNAWKSHVLKALDFKEVRSNGYSFQIELKYKSLKNGFNGAECPIVFEDRRVGHSKMSFKIVIEAFYKVWLMKLNG